MSYNKLTVLVVTLPVLIACGGTASDAGEQACEGVACLPHSTNCNELAWEVKAVVEAPVGVAPAVSGGTLTHGTYDVTRMLVSGGNPNGAEFYGTFEFNGSTVSAYVGGRDASGALKSNSASGVWLTPGASTLRLDWTCNKDPDAASAEAYAFEAKGSQLTLVPLVDDGVQAVFLTRRAAH